MHMDLCSKAGLSSSEVTDIEGAEHFADLHWEGRACSQCELMLHYFILSFGILQREQLFC